MSEVVYRSQVRVERIKGPLRRAYLPAEKEPVTFSVHGAIAEHYFTAVYDRAVTLAGAVATAGGLITFEDLPDDDSD